MKNVEQGALDVYVWTLLLLLKKMEIQFKIAFGRNESLMPEKYAKYAIRIGNNVDLCIHGIVSRIFDATRFDIVKATRELIQWIKKYNSDIMHLYNLHGVWLFTGH